MRVLKTAVFLMLSVGFFPVYAEAKQDDIVVSCTNTTFDDLERIEIVETELTGQYVIVETKTAGTQRYSTVFSQRDLSEGRFPALSPWNGHARTLRRVDVNVWGIAVEATAINCPESWISCVEKF